MEENLVGYLLDALEADEKAEMEKCLREQPEMRNQLELLRRALKPLEVDREQPEPPTGLIWRTLSLVAEERCRPVRTAGLPAVSNRSIVAQSFWRRADVLIAAAILLCVAALIPPGITYVQFLHKRSGCQENLRVLYSAMRSYADHSPDKSFPHPADSIDEEHNVAGMVVPILYENGFLEKSFRPHCPGNEQKPYAYPSIEELCSMQPDDFARHARRIGGCFAYSLGYWEAGKHHAHRYEQNVRIPLIGDEPPADVMLGNANSSNHGGRGQNVIFTDGHFEFRTTRILEPDDDIYLNRWHQVAAGVDKNDAVLGASGVPVK
ncbi:MAG: hypothetical protein KatS3mg105_4545 [Gemmatales bacterium]|nr:MAG: hypothetical protein KatS3mg105_4545 [Gemmatales bacterium]